MRLPGATRPVGEAVPVFPRSHSRFEWPAGFAATWLDSGTTALAIAARLLVLSSGKREPRIVLPAYTCPDVVSAVLWAGARPVLADTLPGVPWLDEAALARHRDDSWVGVIAPHFMGLRHPMETLQRWCKTSGIGLIEDSAQLSPRSPAFQPAAELVVLSFGRGKPIPAGGGVLLALDKYGAAVGEITGALPFTGGTPLGWRARALMHDMAITRPGYRLASSLPWLHVGETRFKPLQAPRRLERGLARLAESVISGWQDRSASVRTEISSLLARLDYTSLPAACGWKTDEPLLRFPILAGSASQRERILSAGQRRGLGVSAMYGSILAELDAMPPMEAAGHLDNARDFAARLLTLPVHTGVRPTQLQGLEGLLS